MSKDIPVEEWIDNGYKRHDISYDRREYNKLADFLFQKRFDDDNGKKYFITVYCYDRKKYPYEHQKILPEIGYMATAQFVLGDDSPFFNIEMNNVSDIKEVEEYFDMFWETFKRPYYERFDTA